jgi:hypothetical protein
VEIDLNKTVSAFLDLDRTGPCQHSRLKPLQNSLLKHSLALTTVSNPFLRTSRSEKTVGISMVHGNPEAQSLCCNPNNHAFLLHECCLECGISQATERAATRLKARLYGMPIRGATVIIVQ